MAVGRFNLLGKTVFSKTVGRREFCFGFLIPIIMTGEVSCVTRYFVVIYWHNHFQDSTFFVFFFVLPLKQSTWQNNLRLFFVQVGFD